MNKINNDFLKEVVGYEDIKRDLYIISDMLNNPEEYTKMGASKLDGLILYGEPGTALTVHLSVRSFRYLRMQKRMFHRSYFWMT